MRTLPIQFGWYADALPTGEYAVLSLDKKTVQTHLGPIATPNSAPLFVRVTNKGGFSFAGQASDSPGTLQWASGAWSTIPQTACGDSPVLWTPDGMLLISDCSIGSQGYRYWGVLGPMDLDPRAITGDQTITSPFGLDEWTYLGDSIWIGQGATSGGVRVWDGTTLRSLVDGDCHCIRATRDLNAVGIAYYQGNGAPSWCVWCTMDELRALPIYTPPAPVYDPIVTIGRPCWQGWLTFGASTGAPGNCVATVPAIGTTPPADLRIYVTTLSGTKLYRFIETTPDSDVDALEAAIAQAHRDEPSMPVMAWWTRAAQAIRIPKGADAVLVDGYWRVGETLAQLETGLRAAMARHPKPWIGAQGYTSNTDNQTDLRAVVPVYARVLRDLGEGCLGFSDGNRKTGYADHPEIHADWQTLAAGIPSAPPIPQPVSYSARRRRVLLEAVL